MGFLFEAEPLRWEESVGLLKRMRARGLQQFKNAFLSAEKTDKQGELRWGDEVEFPVLKIVDGETKLSIRSFEIIRKLQRTSSAVWQPEYGAWMVECTPGQPYVGLAGLGEVETSLKRRRMELQSQLESNEIIPMMSVFPMMGIGNFWTNNLTTESAHTVTGTENFPDICIYPHPRFRTLTRNIRKRRGGKVEIRRQVAGVEPTEQVTGDAMGWGMGCCCLQVTMEARNLEESKRLYDQLAIFAPLLMALFAASPVFTGRLIEDDTRWQIISQSVDDRTPAERGLENDGALGMDLLAGQGCRKLAKSRYDSIDLFIHPDGASFNDNSVVYDEQDLVLLMEGGQIDRQLALHVAHLFARDPLVLFAERVAVADEVAVDPKTGLTDDWEAVQSTNWQSMRWKPPAPVSEITETPGFRVELRTLDLQPSDFENAAAVVIAVSLGRAIVDNALDFYMPMSLVEENMRRATKRGALKTEKFFFKISGVVREASIAEIFDQCHILDLCREKLTMTDTLAKYFQFIDKRIHNEIPTVAEEIRDFVTKHPEYNNDAIITQRINTDLCLYVASLADRSSI